MDGWEGEGVEVDCLMRMGMGEDSPVCYEDLHLGNPLLNRSGTVESTPVYASDTAWLRYL